MRNISTLRAKIIATILLFLLKRKQGSLQRSNVPLFQEDRAMHVTCKMIWLLNTQIRYTLKFIPAPGKRSILLNALYAKIFMTFETASLIPSHPQYPWHPLSWGSGKLLRLGSVIKSGVIFFYLYNLYAAQLFKETLSTI